MKKSEYKIICKFIDDRKTLELNRHNEYEFVITKENIGRLKEDIALFINEPKENVEIDE
ncbi:MAG: hypothetical protein LUD19_01275 [Clostridia bacterium]|nr:hypothetical protein [Clostridia bacterium]